MDIRKQPVVSFKHIAEDFVVRISSVEGRPDSVQTFQRSQLEMMKKMVEELTDAFDVPVLSKVV